MYNLVLIFYRSTHVASVVMPISYSSYDECKNAGEAACRESNVNYAVGYICVPVPVL